MIGCVTLICTVHSLGKRFLTIFSISIGNIFLFLFGAYVLAIKNDYLNPSTNYWIPVTLLCGIHFVGSVIINLPWMLLGEIFPIK